MATNFFQVGGSVPVGNPSYIKRQADNELYHHLKRGEFCYVLTARQMGKSSLKMQTIKRLAAAAWGNVDIDLTSYGTSGVSAAEWYFSLLDEIADAFDLRDEFEDWWDSKERLTPVARMSAFWEELLLNNTSQSIVIYIDEVDSLLSLDRGDFSADDFFAAIRAAYNKRGNKPAFQRLNFCIFGVAAPNDLMSDYERTPFNIGAPIRLQNFTEREAQALAKGMPEDKKSALRAILSWTAGQPYLTQKLCQAFLRNPDKGVEALVQSLFFEEAINSDTHFSNIENRILGEENYNLLMLEDYRRVYAGESLKIDNKATQQLYLKLSGLLREEKGYLIINNKIYREIFDNEWIEQAFGRLKRPYSIDLKRWLESNKKEDALLKGSLLKEAEDWALSRKDLTPDEQAFLNASRLSAVKEEQEQIRQKESLKQNRNLRAALGLALVLALLALYAAFRANNSSKLANNRLDEILAQKRSRDSLRVVQVLQDVAVLKESQDQHIAIQKIQDLMANDLDTTFFPRLKDEIKQLRDF